MQGTTQLESSRHSEVRRLARQRTECFWCGRVHHAEHPLSVCPACTARFRTMPLLEMLPALGSMVRLDGSHTRFAFNYADSGSAAFERECRNYDDFGGSDQLDKE